MIQTTALTRPDLSVLLRIVGSRQGADLNSIVSFEQAHHRQPPTPDQIRQSITRLAAAGFVVQQGSQYFSAPEIQSMFFSEVRNCRDTIEEFDVLGRVLAQYASPPGAES